MGLVMVLSASFVQAARNYGSSWYVFNRQLLWTAIGAAAMVAAARVDYRHLRRLAGPLLVVTAGLLVLVLIPGVGITSGGSTRWLGAGSVRMQPSELAKFAIVLFTADLLTRRAGEMDDARATTRPVLIVAIALAALMMSQPDLGTAILVVGIAGAMLFVAGTRLRVVGGLALAGVAGTLVLARVEPYRWERLTAFLDPWADVGNTGYQAAQGLVALGSGQLTGTGLGASRAKWGFLPAAHTDFIFAIIGEELGLVGTLSVVVLFTVLAVVLVRTAVRAPDRFGTLLVSGVAAWLVGQAVVNIGSVIGLLPITGVPLPFVSAGGSSLVITLTAIGVAYNVCRQARAPRRAPAR
jgi:cell division protein FtsW